MGKKMSSNKNYSWESIDDDFFIWLFSNDKDVIRANDEDSIRSHFIGKLPLDLDLRKGVWEMGVDKIILNNEQSNGLDYNFKDEDDKVIKSGSLSEKRYFTTFEVIEDVYEKGKDLEYNKTVVNKELSTTLKSAHLEKEEIGIFGYDEDRQFFTFIKTPEKWSEIEKAWNPGYYSLTSWDSMWRKLYFHMRRKILNFDRVLSPDFSTGSSIDWTSSFYKQFLFGGTTAWGSAYSNQPYTAFHNFDDTKYKINMFAGLESYLKSINKKMAIVFVVTEKLAKALDLDTKSKFDLLGEFIIGFDKSKINITTNVQNSSKTYVVFDTGLQSNSAFTLEVNKNRLIPIKSTQIITTSTTTKKKIMELKDENGEKKFKIHGSVELLEEKKVKTILKGEYDMKNFEFINRPLKDLVSKDVEMVKLSVLNLTSLSPVYSDEKKEDHLFSSIIDINKKDGKVIHYQNKRERQMHKINSVFTDSLEIDIESVAGSSKERPKFYTGATFVSLYFRKAQNNWFEIY